MPFWYTFLPKKEGVKGCEESGHGSWTKWRFKPSQKPVEYTIPCTQGTSYTYDMYLNWFLRGLEPPFGR